MQSYLSRLAEDHPVLLTCVFLFLIWKTVPLWWRFSHRHLSYIMPHEAKERLADKKNKPLLIDVRSVHSFKTSPLGRIAGAENIPLGALPLQREKLAEIHGKEREIVLLSFGEWGAYKAYRLLQDDGFTSVSILKGGMKGWLKASLPVVKPQAE